MSSTTGNINEEVLSHHLNLIIDHLKQNDHKAIRKIVKQLHANDVASILQSLPPELRQQLWKLLPKSIKGQTLAHLEGEVRSSIFEELEDKDIIVATDSMSVGDLAGVIGDLPAQVSDTVLQSLDEDRRQRLERRLSFTENTAGRLMTTSDVISVRKTVTLAVVLRYLRRLKPLPPHTDALMVIDETGTYLGKLTLSDAVSEHPDTLVSEVMRKDADRVTSDTSDHDVAVLFKRRDLLSVAVLDENSKLLGRITVDNIVDIIVAEADKNLLARAGLAENEDLFAPVIQSAKRRAVWLGANLITVFMAVWVIGRFEEVLDKIVVLAVMMPIVASMGGIAGSQTLTLTIRGMALGQINSANLRWLGNKELMIGMLNGLAWAVVVSVVTLIWFHQTGISIIIAVAMMLNLVAAAISGVIIPVVLNRFGIDPALSGAVVLTTVTDIVGFMSFLGLASLFLL